MADLSKDDILKLAKLARLSISDEEITDFQKEISSILQYVRQLDEITADNLAPTYQVTGLENATRKDEIRPALASPEELLKNAPATVDGQIKVRRMIG